MTPVRRLLHGLGVEKLRGIDSLVIPDVSHVNTNLICMMIAEHMATRLTRR